jgi:hypothetical protein
VRAVDRGGLETIRTRAFHIDETPPETIITSGPADGFSSAATSATFGLSSREPGSKYACRMYPAALTPPTFGHCSAPDGHSASGFTPGTYSFEVQATDPYGNVDPTPAKRTFTVTDSTTSGGARDGALSAGGSTVSAPFDPKLVSAYVAKGATTTFTVLKVNGLPKDAEVLLTCKGRGCDFTRKAVSHAGGQLNLLKALKRPRLQKGAVLEVRLMAAGGETKVGQYLMRRGKPPKASYRCAPPGGKLRSCR